MKPSRAPSTRRRSRGQHTSPDAAAAPAGETHTYEADQDGDLNLQLTMVSFADAKAKKGETYVVYAAADDGAATSVSNSWKSRRPDASASYLASSSAACGMSTFSPSILSAFLSST